MSSIASSDSYVFRPKKIKLLARCYEVLVLLRMLDPIQGGRIQGENFESDNVRMYSEAKLRRKALDSLSAACDYKRGGDTVTSIVLGRGLHGPQYWVAANSVLQVQIQDFLERVLKFLGEATAQTDFDEENLQEDLFQMITEQHRPRLRGTWSLLQRNIKMELDLIKDPPSEDDQIVAYRSWLLSFQHSCNDQADLVSACRRAYDQRSCVFMQPPSRTAILKKIRHEVPKGYVRHYVGRMGATLRAAKVLTQTALQQPWLFSDFVIKPCNLTAPSRPPAVDRTLTLEGITRRMFSKDSPDLEPIREKLAILDRSQDLEKEIRKKYKDPTFRPRIHAELNVLEHIYVAGVQFYDDDKYIACSKPACFCCYHYITHHPGGFVRPSSHNKLYINWEPPGPVWVEDKDGKRRKATMNGMIGAIRAVAVEKINKLSKGETSSKFRPDSETGITSTVTEQALSARNLSNPRVQSPSNNTDEVTRMLASLRLAQTHAAPSTSQQVRAGRPQLIRYDPDADEEIVTRERSGQPFPPIDGSAGFADDVSLDGGVPVW